METTTSKKELAVEILESIFSKSISYLEGKGDGSADKSTPSKRYLSKTSQPKRAQSVKVMTLKTKVHHQSVSGRRNQSRKEPNRKMVKVMIRKTKVHHQSVSGRRNQSRKEPNRKMETDLKYLQESTRTEKVAENSYSILDQVHSYSHAEDFSTKVVTDVVYEGDTNDGACAEVDGRDTYNTNVKGQQDLTRGDVEAVHKEDAELDSLRDPKSDQTYEKLYPGDTLCGKSLTGAQSLLPTRDIGEASNTTASERKNIPVTKPKVSKRCDIKSQLIEVLDANGIVSFQIMHKPGTDNQIEIIGTGVERLNEELSIVATHEGYVVVTKNVEFDSDTNGTTNWIHLCSGPIARGTFALARHDLDQRISVIDAIMQGKDKKQRQIKIEYFGMTVAHAFLTKEHNETLMSSTEHFTKVCNEAITNACQIDYYMSAQGYPDIDIAGSPRLLYKYWMPRHVDHDWAVMQDIVFFKVDNDQIRSLDLIGSPNIDVTKSGQQQKNNAKAFITSIFSQDDLNEYVGRRIHCAGKSGTLIDQPYTRHEGCTLGHHLAFTLDKNERLKGGDCGSFLCLEEKDSGRLDILGMFIGQFKTDRRIHQAVILSWNIRQVEETEELKISDIKLAEPDMDNDSVAEEAQDESEYYTFTARHPCQISPDGAMINNRMKTGSAIDKEVQVPTSPSEYEEPLYEQPYAGTED